LLLSTVLASELKADSTAETVECDNIGLAGALSNDGASRTGCLFLDSLNSMSSSGSILLNDDTTGDGGSGNAMSSVSSKTSASGSGCGAGLMSASGVAASRLASIASMSSWLLLAAGSGAGGGGGGAGAGFGAAATGFGAGAIADGGISFITAGFAAAAGLAGFSAAAGFASSSAMMRRIDARISSIEGSWTFAGCVISDSTSKPFYTKATKELPVPDVQVGIFIAQA
jgi:hypothetical protein